jgi:hypothetical protein
MLPLIILGLGGAAAFRAFKPKCQTCESQFTLNESCVICSENVCGDCGFPVLKAEYKGWPLTPGGRVCADHEQALDDQLTRLQMAIDRPEHVSLFSKTFRGVTPQPKLNLPIATEEHTDRDDAERELKIIAAMQECESVMSVEFKRDTGQHGNYRYSVWKAVGII